MCKKLPSCLAAKQSILRSRMQLPRSGRAGRSSPYTQTSHFGSKIKTGKKEIKKKKTQQHPTAAMLRAVGNFFCWIQGHAKQLIQLHPSGKESGGTPSVAVFGNAWAPETSCRSERHIFEKTHLNQCLNDFFKKYIYIYMYHQFESDHIFGGNSSKK